VILNADLPNEWRAAATVLLAEPPPADVAVLQLAALPDEQVAPVSFGRIAHQADVVRCTAVGFPRWKARIGRGSSAVGGAIAPYRDSHQADGTIAGLSNWRQGTLEISVEPPSEDGDPARSPWEGMSGAPVWSSNSIVGLISEHHHSDGLNRLTAVRVERWYDQLAPGQLRRLCDLIGLPGRVGELVIARAPQTGRAAEPYSAVGDDRSVLPLRSVGLIVDQMLGTGDLADPANLHQFLSLLPTDILSTLAYSPQPRAQLINVVRRCSRAVRGRQALVDSLTLAVADAPSLSSILAVLDREWPA
jgi:hypothetical protein